jgi:hypothetical protein
MMVSRMYLHQNVSSPSLKAKQPKNGIDMSRPFIKKSSRQNRPGTESAEVEVELSYSRRISL